jgi:hypothetical protein
VPGPQGTQGVPGAQGAQGAQGASGGGTVPLALDAGATTTHGPEYPAGTGTTAGGGGGTQPVFHGVLTVEPSTAQADQIALLIRAPNSTWGTGAIRYSEGQAILYINEANEVRFRVDRTGNVGFTGGLHVSPGANGAPTAGITQAVWLQPLAAMVPLVADLNSGNTTSDIALFRSDGGNSTELRIKGNFGTEIGDRMTVWGDTLASYVMHNCTFDGTAWRFRANGTAQMIQLGDSYQAQYQSSVSGLAGQAITWVGTLAASNVNYTVPQGRLKISNSPTTPAGAAIASGEAEIMTYGARMFTKGYLDAPVPIDATRAYRYSGTGLSIGTALTTVISSDTMAAGTYAFEINGFYQGSATTAALRVALLVPGTPSQFIIALMAATSAAATSSAVGIANGTAVGAATASGGGTALPFQVTGSFVTPSQGVSSFRAAASSGTVTINQGTYMRFTRIA